MRIQYEESSTKFQLRKYHYLVYYQTKTYQYGRVYMDIKNITISSDYRLVKRSVISRASAILKKNSGRYERTEFLNVGCNTCYVRKE